MILIHIWGSTHYEAPGGISACFILGMNFSMGMNQHQKHPIWRDFVLHSPVMLVFTRYRMVQGFQSINIHFGLKLCLASTWKQGDGGYCNAFAPRQAAELKTTAFFVPAGCCFWGSKSTYWFWEMGEWNDSYIDIYYCRSFPHSLRLAPKRMAKQILCWQSNMT